MKSYEQIIKEQITFLRTTYNHLKNAMEKRLDNDVTIEFWKGHAEITLEKIRLLQDILAIKERESK